VLIVRSDPGDTQIYAAPPVLTGAEILVELLTVDGAGSGLDADLLDGQSSAHYATAASVTAEASARAAADTALDGRVDALEADPTTATALAAEASARAAADTALDARLDVIEADTSLADHEAETTTAHGIPAQIAAAIAALVDTAPGTLDTLNELAAALGDDPNFAATMTAALAGKQPLDSDLTAIAALSTTPFGRALLELVDAAALRSAAGLVIGTDVQPADSDLTAIAALATTSYGRAFLALADAAAGRSALGLGTMATQAAASYAALTGAAFTGAVALPATAPGLNGAARYTAIDPATGRIAINGQEIGGTGWRDVTSICVAGSLDPANVGTFQMRREGNFVTYRVSNLLLAPGTGALTFVNTGIAAGFRIPQTSPATFLNFDARPVTSATSRMVMTAWAQRIDWQAATSVNTGATSQTRPAAGIAGEVTFVTSDAWPTSLPGTQLTAPATLS
jgi:hypothetical protein